MDIVKPTQTFQINKWLRVFLSLLVALLGAVITWGTSYDWAKIMDADTAGKMVFALGVLKTLYAAFAPGSGVATTPTDGYVITQRGVVKLPSGTPATAP